MGEPRRVTSEVASGDIMREESGKHGKLQQQSDKHMTKDKALSRLARWNAAGADEDQSALVKRILEQKPGGEKILAKYATTGEMKDRARRDLVSIVVAEMFEKYGFLDTKGLVAQDFDLLFGAETSSKLLEKWDFLKAKVIEQAKDISKTPLLDHLIQSAEENTEDDEVPALNST
ncbi:hypothetical protein PO909_007620 [Leuciscus waleckii]